MLCLKCQQEIRNTEKGRKFCSRSCAASFNNRAKPKRTKKQHICSEENCQKLSGRNKFCSPYCRTRKTQGRLQKTLRSCAMETCQNLTTNRKYCSKECNGSASGRNNLAVGLISKCGKCDRIYTKKTTHSLVSCPECREASMFSNLTYGEVKGSGTSNWSSRAPYIRTHARKTLIASGRSQECQVCSYDIHVDCCHIKAVKDHGDHELISTMNHPDNLLFLCKNHHWEFDNGFADEITSQIEARSFDLLQTLE